MTEYSSAVVMCFVALAKADSLLTKHSQSSGILLSEIEKVLLQGEEFTSFGEPTRLISCGKAPNPRSLHQYVSYKQECHKRALQRSKHRCGIGDRSTMQHTRPNGSHIAMSHPSFAEAGVPWALEKPLKQGSPGPWKTPENPITDTCTCVSLQNPVHCRMYVPLRLGTNNVTDTTTGNADVYSTTIVPLNQCGQMKLCSK